MTVSPALHRTALLALLGLVLIGCPREGDEGAVSKPPPWPTGRLVSVELVGESTILVAAEHGTIHRSDDAGKSWKRARGPAVNSLAALTMADAEVGWAVGDGVILKTDEAGSNWRRQRLPRRADEVQLMAVTALDRDRAIAVGAGGLRLYTLDGGAVWKEASPALVDAPLDEPRHALPTKLRGDLHDVACEAGRLGRCWAVGEGLYRTLDSGVNWEAVPTDHFQSTEPISFSFEGVEIGPAEAARIEALATRWRYASPLVWRIDVFLGALEVERIGRQRDPAALLELIEARAQEARSLLESAGIDASRIEVSDAPPWNYEDSLDEDPALLERYFDARTRESGAVRIRIDDQARLYGLALSADGHAVAVGEAGKVLRRVLVRGGAFAWKVEGRKGKHDLFAVALGPGDRPVLVGAQGGLWEAGETFDPNRPGGFTQRDTGEGPAAFAAFRDLAFENGPGGPWGVAVGESGRIWVAEGTPLSWSIRLAPGEQERPLAPAS